MLNIKLEKFTGPLSLLLQMIEKEKMDITEISLAKIADQYINYIKKQGIISPDNMANFLVVATKLLLIKSKALLPFLLPEENEDIEDLEKQLKMYKEFINATEKIEKIISKKKFMFTRDLSKIERKNLLQNTPLFSPPINLTKKDLKTIFTDIIFRVQPVEKINEEKLEYKINIEEKILSIQNILINKIKFSFNKIFANTKNKTNIIVSFLAMLELEKQRKITINQNEIFSEIIINKL